MKRWNPYSYSHSFSIPYGNAVLQVFALNSWQRLFPVIRLTPAPREASVFQILWNKEATSVRYKLHYIYMWSGVRCWGASFPQTTWFSLSSPTSQHWWENECVISLFMAHIALLQVVDIYPLMQVESLTSFAFIWNTWGLGDWVSFVSYAVSLDLFCWTTFAFVKSYFWIEGMWMRYV